MITGMECFRQWTVIIAIPFILPAAVAAAASGCWSVASYVCVFFCVLHFLGFCCILFTVRTAFLLEDVGVSLFSELVDSLLPD